MSDRDARLRDALARIQEEASKALAAVGDDDADSDDNGNHHGHGHDHGARICTPKALPTHLQIDAARRAVEINPMNAPLMGPVDAVARNFISDPLRIAVVTSKYWGAESQSLTVSFMESPSRGLRTKILEHMNAWGGSVRFEETGGTGQVRITLQGDGYWSYLGTDILSIPEDEPTMSLQGFTESTRDSEFRRVVRHEAGHTLAFPHEHMRRALVDLIDPGKAYDYFRRTQGWDRRMVDAQVLTPLDERSLLSTPADQTSIMCYQLPGSITRNGRPILGGPDINASDHAFVARVYPLSRADRADGACSDAGSNGAGYANRGAVAAAAAKGAHHEFELASA
jgi:hypothetical protein